MNSGRGIACGCRPRTAAGCADIGGDFDIEHCPHFQSVAALGSAVASGHRLCGSGTLGAAHLVHESVRTSSSSQNEIALLTGCVAIY